MPNPRRPCALRSDRPKHRRASLRASVSSDDARKTQPNGLDPVRRHGQVSSASAHVLRVNCVRSAEVAAQRRLEGKIMRASLRHGLTHRCEEPPPLAATGLPSGCGSAVTACRRLFLGTALDSMRPGAGAPDPGMVSHNAYLLVARPNHASFSESGRAGGCAILGADRRCVSSPPP
jgi:hypothetical protein